MILFFVGGPLQNKKVIDISAGDSHTAALTNDGQVFLWGCFRVRISACYLNTYILLNKFKPNVTDTALMPIILQCCIISIKLLGIHGTLFTLFEGNFNPCNIYMLVLYIH